MLKNTIFLIIAVGSCNLTNAQSLSGGIAEEVNIYQKLYNAPLVVSGKDQVSLNDLHSKKPLLLGLIFTRCSGVCNPFLMQLNDNLRLTANKSSVNVVIVSFDPEDDADDMVSLASRLGLETNEQWTFAVTDSIAQLNRSIGFYPLWDSVRNQYDHDALLVGINKEGYITKKLIGIRSPHDLEQLIASANNVFLPSYRLPGNSSLFSCFNYDPETGRNTPGPGLLFLALPAVTTVILLVAISFVVRNKIA